MKKLVFPLLLTVLWSLGAAAQESSEGDEHLLRDWIRILSADDFGGRKPMTEYEDLTVEYLARELEGLGLEPAFDGSWFQPFGMISVTAGPVGNKLAVKGKKKEPATELEPRKMIGHRAFIIYYIWAILMTGAALL